VPRTLRYTDEAVADLEAIRGWLAQPGSGAVANRRLKAIRSAIRRLKQAPCLFAFGEHPPVRELPVAGHRVMYLVEPDTGRNRTAGNVLVLRVYGPGQSRERLF
jgi:plasmid stabilization system protein ParE